MRQITVFAATHRYRPFEKSISTLNNNKKLIPDRENRSGTSEGRKGSRKFPGTRLGGPKRDKRQGVSKLTEHVYEGLFILDSDKYARNPEEVSSQVTQTIESFGGVVRVSRLWEERRLAYPIDGHKRGTYWLAYFRLDTDKMKDLNRQFQINGSIIRFLIQTIDERLEETLVEHALAGPIRREAETEEEVAVPSFDVDEVEEEGDEEAAVDVALEE